MRSKTSSPDYSAKLEEILTLARLSDHRKTQIRHLKCLKSRKNEIKNTQNAHVENEFYTNIKKSQKNIKLNKK
jgi:hypothetical protein